LHELKKIDEEAAALEEIMKKHGTDKGVKAAHYHHTYAQLLKRFKYKRNMSLFEVGANHGNSMNFWSDFFKDPYMIVGMRYGITDAQMVPKYGTKIKIIDGDQSKVSSLRATIETALGSLDKPESLDSPKWKDTGFDIIIDDGSHVPKHILLTFMEYWPYVRPGGMYVIEDMGFAYCDSMTTMYGYEITDGGIDRPGSLNLAEWFKQLTDVVERRHTMAGCDFVVFSEEIDRTVWSVEFVAGLIIIEKQSIGQRDSLAAVQSAVPAHCYHASCEMYKQKLQKQSRKWQ
jgi:hypothetical protein